MLLFAVISVQHFAGPRKQHRYSHFPAQSSDEGSGTNAVFFFFLFFSASPPIRVLIGSFT